MKVKELRQSEMIDCQTLLNNLVAQIPMHLRRYSPNKAQLLLFKPKDKK